MKRHTNLTHEITGSHHNEKTDWWAVAIAVLIIIATILIIGEQTGITSQLLGTV